MIIFYHFLGICLEYADPPTNQSTELFSSTIKNEEKKMVKTHRPKILSLPYPYTNQNTQPQRISQPLLLVAGSGPDVGENSARAATELPSRKLSLQCPRRWYPCRDGSGNKASTVWDTSPTQLDTLIKTMMASGKTWERKLLNLSI